MGLIASTTKGGNAAAVITSDPINSTGGRFICLAFGYFTEVGTSVISDNKGNVYVSLTPAGPSNKTRLFYCINPKVGTGHIFTGNGALNYGSATAMVFDDIIGGVQGEAGGDSTAGPVTATENHELFISSVVLAAAGGTPAIANGFTIAGGLPFNTGLYVGHSAAYKKQAIAGPETAIWSGGITTSGTTLAAFKEMPRFPDPNETHIAWEHFNHLPTDYSPVTLSHTYEDEGRSFNETTTTPPERWECTFPGLDYNEMLIFDNFANRVRLSQPFLFVDKWGVLHENVRIETYERSHNRNISWSHNVRFVLVKYP